MSERSLTERLTFRAEWYDKVASLTRKFYLRYFPADETLELYDLGTGKTFLRRTRCEGVRAEDLRVGGAVTVFSRVMRITEAADGVTGDRLSTEAQGTLALIKPHAARLHAGEILDRLSREGLEAGRVATIRPTSDDVKFLYGGGSDSELEVPDDDDATSGTALALGLTGKNAVERLRRLMGPSDPAEARREAPASLRALYGEDPARNAIHGSADARRALEELERFFPDPRTGGRGAGDTAELKDCTCCVIKPHAVRDRLTGRIVDSILKAGYAITAMRRLHLDPSNAEEFLEVYRGVLPDYPAMVAELQSGACVAMEIRHEEHGPNVPAEFRKFCGPMDPETARRVRPESLRAKYGETRIRNAVHCSDLPEDGLLEVEYFFKILSSA